MTENFSIETFYQWSHRKTKIDPAGSYFSTNDYVSPGTTHAHILNGVGSDSKSLTVGTEGYGQWAIRGADVEPEDEGNLGIAFKWYAENLNDTEFGFMLPNIPVVSQRSRLFRVIKILQELVPIQIAGFSGALLASHQRPK